MPKLLCTCGKSYDVSARAPGTRVRCRACATVLTVPESRKADAATRVASERLRRARGEPCARHPKALALDPCERCQKWMCETCRAKPPSSHLCKDCAPAVGATQALPVDFGLLATLAIGAKLVARGLPWALVLNFLASTVKWALAVPFMVVVYAVWSQANQKDPAMSELILVIGTAALGAIIVSLFDTVLIPAANIVLFDRVLRDEGPAPFFAVIRDAVRRSWERKGALILTFLLLGAALLGSLIILLPFILAYELVGDFEVVNAGLVFAIPAAGAVLGGFGLSIPAVILEHRSATAAFGRAYNLARLRLPAATVFGTAFVVIAGVVWYRLSQFEQAWGLAPALLVAFFADIAWPALLVAAYHGLVAEEARLVGRRS